MTESKKPRRKLTVADRLAEIDSMIEARSLQIKRLRERREAIIAEARKKAEALLAELPQAVTR